MLAAGKAVMMLDQTSSLIAPEFSFRFSIEEIRERYGTLDAAFEAGAYLLVAEYAEAGSELEGCGLILGGALGRGHAVLKGRDTLSGRGLVCRAFAEWSLGDDEAACGTLAAVREDDAHAARARTFLTLIEKPQITVFVTAAFLPPGDIANAGSGARASERRYGRFVVKHVGTQLPENAYGYEPHQPFDAFLQSLPAAEQPDFIFAMTPQWVAPRNLEKVTIPKVIWCHDGDMFIYRVRDTLALYDVRICLTSLEQFEMSRAVGAFSISNFMSDPLNTEFPKTRFNRNKEFDLIFTGAAFDSYHAEKSRFIYKLLELTDDYKIAVVNGYLPQEEYYELLSRGKFLPIVSRIAGNPTPRWRDALASSAFVLYPEGTTYGKAFPGCFPVGAGSLAADIRHHLERYDAGDPAYDLPRTAAAVETEMAIFREGRETLFERQLKLAAFSAFILRPPTPLSPAEPAVRRQVWLAPCIDPSIYGRLNVTAKLARLADETPEAELTDERAINNLAHIYAALAVVAGEAPEAERWRARAEQLFEEGCRRFPASLILHFNHAHWRFFRSADWRFLNDPTGNRTIAGAADAAPMFWRLIDAWDRFTLDPIGMDVGLPYTLLEADRSFPYYEYAQQALVCAVEPGAKPHRDRLLNMLKGAAYGYLSWEAIKRKSFDEGFEYLDKALRINPDNLALLRFRLDALLANADTLPAGHQPPIANTIAGAFLAVANTYPAILLSHTHRVGKAFIAAGRTDDLRQVLDAWYRLGNITHSTKPDQRLENEIEQFIAVAEFKDYFPKNLSDKMEKYREAERDQKDLSQYETLILTGLKARSALHSVVWRSLLYRLQQFVQKAAGQQKQEGHRRWIAVITATFRWLSMYDRFYEAYVYARLGRPLSSMRNASLFQMICFWLTRLVRGTK